MKVLVTGSNGFIGRNLVWNLRTIQEGKNRTRPGLVITEVIEYDIGDTRGKLEEACRECGFVFHLAGVNRPKKEEAEFMQGNLGFVGVLLETLKKYGNKCPVLFASSIQATLSGRFAGSLYGKSKLEGEKAFFAYGREYKARVLVYRFPNIFGKWCRPNYNSAVATFCHAIANGLGYTVNDPATELELAYIDDVINELLDALEGKEHKKGDYCYVPVTHRATLGEIEGLLKTFKQMPKSLRMPDIPNGSFAKKLFSTYLSFLPTDSAAYCLAMNVDSRGIFTELIKTRSSGQVSVNVVRPGAMRGEHWHNSKWEIFVVVSGHGLIQQRQIGINPETGRAYPVTAFEVTGEKMQAIQMLPGYAHNIINLSKTENLVTVMWANEPFDEACPDTFYEKVEP